MQDKHRTILYKNNHRTCRIWATAISGCKLFITHGTINGLQQTEEIIHSNHQHAVDDEQSRINHKILREGYSLDPDCPPPGKPMLLHNYRDHGSKLPLNIYHQAKLDGHRCIATKYTMMSRKNDPITSMPHIAKELRELPNDITLDGEIYLHGASLQYHSSMIRNYAPQPGHEQFKYVVFDIQNRETYVNRLDTLQSIFKYAQFKHITLLESTPGKRGMAQIYMNQYREQGYEGAILRSPHALYEKDTRSYAVQKVKQTLFARFPVINIVCSDKGREAGLAIVECRTNEGKTFRARIAASEDIRRFIYKHRATSIPSAADIEFSDFTDEGIPQHPRCIQFYKGLQLGQATEVQSR